MVTYLEEFIDIWTVYINTLKPEPKLKVLPMTLINTIKNFTLVFQTVTETKVLNLSYNCYIYFSGLALWTFKSSLRSFILFYVQIEIKTLNVCACGKSVSRVSP